MMVCSECSAVDDALYAEHEHCPECDAEFCGKCADKYREADADCVGDPPRYVDCSYWHHCEASHA